MKIKIHKDRGVVVLDIDESRLDVTNAEALKARFSELMDEGDRFVIDVGNVRFVDTFGIGALLWCWMRLNASQGSLRVTSLSEPVREVFDLVKVSDILEVDASSAAAVANLEADRLENETAAAAKTVSESAVETEPAAEAAPETEPETEAEPDPESEPETTAADDIGSEEAGS